MAAQDVICLLCSESTPWVVFNTASAVTPGEPLSQLVSSLDLCHRILLPPVQDFAHLTAELQGVSVGQIPKFLKLPLD